MRRGILAAGVLAFGLIVAYPVTATGSSIPVQTIHSGVRAKDNIYPAPTVVPDGARSVTRSIVVRTLSGKTLGMNPRAVAVPRGTYVALTLTSYRERIARQIPVPRSSVWNVQCKVYDIWIIDDRTTTNFDSPYTGAGYISGQVTVTYSLHCSALIWADNSRITWDALWNDDESIFVQFTSTSDINAVMLASLYYKMGDRAYAGENVVAPARTAVSLSPVRTDRDVRYVRVVR